jgi:hypothetical protein
MRRFTRKHTIITPKAVGIAQVILLAKPQPTSITDKETPVFSTNATAAGPIVPPNTSKAKVKIPMKPMPMRIPLRIDFDKLCLKIRPKITIITGMNITGPPLNRKSIGSRRRSLMASNCIIANFSSPILVFIRFD